MHPLDKYTYQVNYNPNCPSPFEVVTGGTAFLIDRHDRRCFRSYGKTLDDARNGALLQIQDYDRNRLIEREHAKFAGLVCA